MGARIPLSRREGARSGNVVGADKEGRELGGKSGDKHREASSKQAKDGTLEVGVLASCCQFASEKSKSSVKGPDCIRLI